MGKRDDEKSRGDDDGGSGDSGGEAPSIARRALPYLVIAAFLGGLVVFIRKPSKQKTSYPVPVMPDMNRLRARDAGLEAGLEAGLGAEDASAPATTMPPDAAVSP